MPYREDGYTPPRFIENKNGSVVVPLTTLNPGKQERDLEAAFKIKTPNDIVIQCEHGTFWFDSNVSSNFTKKDGEPRFVWILPTDHGTMGLVFSEQGVFIENIYKD